MTTKKNYYWKNPELFRARGRALYRKHRARWQAERYGMTLDDLRMIQDIVQDGLCPVCRLKLEDDTLVVDHDHTTGEVRGLLHKGCNSALGVLKDSPELLDNGAAYLRGELP